ncbi:unnamed protein product [Parascedosporium putredinis]|uniref:Kinetochore-associated protein MTW1 n=1 Tax=Parascedosporium putredinis TaxID=1442378 RepID=A0A9P1H9V3_9PEZI|nr:unnamed protein product [Parascedosporium putredinis]CAI8000646.1 unnamed protein product [Parascedosporium putredinis]
MEGFGTRHFGYPPVSLLDDIINTVNILAESALKSIEQYLSNSSPKALGFRDAKKSSSSTAAPASSSSHGTASAPLTAADAAKFEIDNGTHQLETLLCSSIDRNFDIFELYVMKNLLRIAPEDRPWIRLRHYEGLDFDRAAAATSEGQNADSGSGRGDVGGGDSPGGPTATSVNVLRRKLRASLRLNALLQAEKAKNDALLAQLYSLQALRSLSTSLKNMAPDLVASVGTDNDDNDGQSGGRSSAGSGSSSGNRNWRKERVGYVEGLARKHLENARGLELGAQGEVRDGEWQGEGRTISKAEVEDLERVVGILAGGVMDEDAMDES